MTTTVAPNPLSSSRSWPPPPDQLRAFHQKMPGYVATVLLDAPKLAAELGLGRLLVKVESQRMGLPSFKILGASWATYQAIVEHLGAEPAEWSNLTELADRLAGMRPFRLAAATDGNHGRAVAYMARMLGFDCDIFVPAGTAPARIAAIESEGATVTVVDGDYDDTIARSAQEAGEGCLVISDTSWPGYETTPRRILEGYTTIFAEVDDAVDAAGIAPVDLAVVPVGVGALMAAAVTHYRGKDAPSRSDRTVVVSIEPSDANCVQVSIAANDIVQVPGPHRSIMVGLNCGLPSLTAWPLLREGIDWTTSVDDDAARQAMRDLADAGAVAGETGAAALAGLRALVADPDAVATLGPLDQRTALVVVTEGATDPGAYLDIVGRRPESVGRLLQAAG